MAVVNTTAILMCCYALIVCKLIILSKEENMIKNTKSDKDFMRSMVEAWKCGEVLWEEIYFKTQDIDVAMSISNTLCELFNEQLYKNAMDLIYAFCMSLDIDNIDFAVLYTNDDMMVRFVNEVVLESEDYIYELEPDYSEASRD